MYRFLYKTPRTLGWIGVNHDSRTHSLRRVLLLLLQSGAEITLALSAYLHKESHMLGESPHSYHSLLLRVPKGGPPIPVMKRSSPLTLSKRDKLK